MQGTVPKAIMGFSVTAILIAIVVAGCGGSSGESSGGESAGGELTKTEYLAKGDAICLRGEKAKTKALNAYNERLERENREMTPKGEEDLIVNVALPPISQMTEELAALGEPTSGGSQAAKFVSSLERAVAEVEQNPLSIVSGEPEPFKAPKDLARQFGFKDCSSF